MKNNIFLVRYEDFIIVRFSKVSELRDQERKSAVAEQRTSDYLKDLKELEKQFIAAEKDKERAITEKTMLEKQFSELQARFSQLEQNHHNLQDEKHKTDIELATRKVKSKG